MSTEVVTKPYPNEHAARLNPPGKYKEIRRQNDKFGKGVHAIFGIYMRDGERVSELQAIRFDRGKFTPKQARDWLKEHDYKAALEEAVPKKKTLDELVKEHYEEKAIGEGQGTGGPRQGVGGVEVCRCPSCGHEVEHERGTPCAEVACPECGATMGGKLPAKAKFLWRLLEAVAKSVVRRESLARVWKERDGSMWYVAVVSKAVLDLEGELVTTEGMDYSISLARKHDLHSGMHIQHAVPWTRVGRSVYELRLGPFWLEVGKFTDGFWLAEKAFDRLQEDTEGTWKLSIGFITSQVQAKQGVYTRLLKYDTSIVDEPACPQTKILVNTGGNMSEEILKLLAPESDEEREQYEDALKELLAAASKSLTTVEKADDLASKCGRLVGMLEGEQKALAQEILDGLKKPKPEEEEEKAAPKKKEVEGLEPLVQAVADLSKEVEKLGTRVTGLQDDSASLKEQVTLAKALASLVESWPKAAVAARPSEGAEGLSEAAVKKVVEELGLKEVAQHPFASFAGAPGKEEGGL